MTYTKELGIDMAAMIMTSMHSERITIFWLNFTRSLYLVSPFLMRLALTVLKKYQFSIASTRR